MDTISQFLTCIESVGPSQICQGSYAIAAAIILSVNLLPTDQQHALLDYGARNTDGGREKKKGFIPWVISCTQVPHSWFIHFYILSASASAFWAWQYLTRGWVLEGLVKMEIRNGPAGMTLLQVYVAWGLMALQGARRLYESLYVTKPGSSPMASLHWIVGLAYYTNMSVTVWIEGSGAIFDSWNGGQPDWQMLARIPIGAALFFIGWFKQNQCHSYLAGLKKYTLPDEDWFRYIICPHYTSECIVYLGISIAAAPPGSVLNRTVVLGMAFVAVNLGTTAQGTKQWYASKFGADKVASKWKMIPFVF